MVGWMAVRPSFIAEMPFTGVLTFAMGVQTAHFIAPGSSWQVRVAGLVLLVPLSVAAAAGMALYSLEAHIRLTEDERREFHGKFMELQRLHQQKLKREEAASERAAHPRRRPSWSSGKRGTKGDEEEEEEEEEEDCKADTLPALADFPEGAVLRALKFAFLLLAETDKEAPRDDHGTPILTHRALEISGDKLSEERATHADLQEYGEADKDIARNARRIIKLLFSVMDVDKDDQITFDEFSAGVLLVAAAEEAPEARRRLWFRALDLDNSGSISRAELLYWVKIMQAVDAIPAADAVVRTWSGDVRAASPEEIVDQWLERYDVNHDDAISTEEFGAMADAIDFSSVVPSSLTDALELVVGKTMEELTAEDKAGRDRKSKSKRGEASV